MTDPSSSFPSWSPAAGARSGPSFRTRVLLYLFAFVLLLTTVLSIAFIHSQRKALRHGFVREGRALAQLLADGARLGVFAADPQTLRHAVAPAFRNADVSRVAVFDARGNLLVDVVNPAHAGHGPAQRPLRVPTDLQSSGGPVARVIQVEGPRSIVFWSTVHDRLAYQTAEELYFGLNGMEGEPAMLGSLATMISKRGLQQSTAGVFGQGLLLGGVFLALGALLALRVARDAARPLGHLVEVFRERGIQVEDSHDLGALQDSFSILLERLDQAVHTINDLNRDLEQRVDARTEELAAANAELRAARDHLEERVRERTAELEQAHRSLLQAEKLGAVGKLAASLAHEINNPIFGVRNVLQELRNSKGLAGDRARMVEMAIEECNRVAGLIRKLREFNRPSSEKVGPVDLHRSVDTMLALCRKEFEARRVRVEREYTEGLPPVRGVEDQIKQVVLNLLTNAAEALPEDGGIIRVKTARDDGRAELRVVDNGSGIPEEHLDRIFDPFFTTKAELSGTGLGLSVCHGIVASHDGTIGVESRFGEGTTFRVRLPIMEEERGAQNLVGG